MQQLIAPMFVFAALPFTKDEFFSVFSRYNGTVWPAQIALYLTALIVTLLAFRRSKAATRVAYALLAVLWLWMGLVYHGRFLVTINPAAPAFAAAFVVQGLFFIYLAARRKPALLLPTRDLSGWAGGILVVVALFLYPAASALAGHHYPAQPTFGLPCPTTIFTLGMLLWAAGSGPTLVFVIPLAWTIIGAQAAVRLGLPEDLFLILSFIIVTAVLARRHWSLRAAAVTGKVEPASSRS